MEDWVMNPELVATCNALGNVDLKTKKYVKSEDLEALLCDIRKWLRIDDTKSVQTKEFLLRRSLARMDVVQNDFVPILKDCCEDDAATFNVMVDLLLNLTAPVILLFDDKLPTEKLEKQRYLELTEINRNVKIQFGRRFEVWKPFYKYMFDFISSKWENRDIDQHDRFQKILLIIRNILLIPLDSTLDRSVTGELNTQDRLIDNLEKAGVLEIILMLLSDEDGEMNNYCFHILEVVSALLREQRPEILAKCYNPSEPEVDKKSRSAIERESDEHELMLLVTKEKEQNLKVKPFHSRFKEATFQVTNMKSLSDKNLIVHKIPQDLELTTLGFRKQSARKGKNYADLTDYTFCSGDGSSKVVWRSPPHIVRILSKFCHEFLKSYNTLMQVTEAHLVRSKGMQNDETYYLWAACFFMEFNRFSQPDIKLVSQTFSVKEMHYFHTQIDSYLTKLTTEKKIFLPWSRRLHYALRAYRELIFTLAFSDSSKNQEFVEVNKAVKTSIFYEDDYRELLLKLIKDFNPVRMSRSYLVDLVMTNHVFLKLLKVYCASQPKIEVKTKVKKPRMRKVSKKKTKSQEPVDLKECWDNLENGLNAALEGIVVLPTAEDDEDVMPLDPTVDFDDDVQKLAITKRLNRLLKEEKAAAAVALLRNARGTWPEDEENLFGSANSSIEEEMETLKKILYFDLPPAADENSNSEDDGKRSGSDQEEEEVVTRKTNQLSYDLVFKKYCHSKVIQSHALLLKDFGNNSVELNHAIVKLYHRIAVDLELYGMFFQASLFRIFQNIFREGESNESSKELVQFAKFIVKKFVHLVPKNEMLMVELLFWKSAALAQQLTSGYCEGKISREDDFPVNEDE